MTEAVWSRGGTASPPDPHRFGPYQIVGKLGRGGMGVVLDAISPDGRPCALKLLRATGDPDKQKVFAARFQREGRILQKLSHPGIVKLLDSGAVHGVFYLAMERIEGKSLGSLMSHGPLDADAVLAIGLRLADTLVHLHEIGIVHRDVKPDNVIVDTSGRPVLTDFGLARLAGATTITRANELVGSVGYIAPELIKGARPSPLSDQYALGRMLFNLCTRRKDSVTLKKEQSFVEALAQSLKTDWTMFPASSQFSRLGVVIGKMISRTPDQRYNDLYEVIVELDRVLHIETRPPSAREGPTDRHPTATDSMLSSALESTNPDESGDVANLADLAARMADERREPTDPRFDNLAHTSSDAVDTNDLLVRLRGRRELSHLALEREASERSAEGLKRQAQEFWRSRLDGLPNDPSNTPTDDLLQKRDPLQHFRDMISDLVAESEADLPQRAVSPAPLAAKHVEEYDEQPTELGIDPEVTMPGNPIVAPVPERPTAAERPTTAERPSAASERPTAPPPPTPFTAFAAEEPTESQAVQRQAGRSLRMLFLRAILPLALLVAIAFVGTTTFLDGRLHQAPREYQGLMFHYEGDWPPPLSNLAIAASLLTEAEKVRAAGDREATKRLLGLCIRAGDLVECHRALADPALDLPSDQAAAHRAYEPHTR